jgi:hypothetical protein
MDSCTLPGEAGLARQNGWRRHVRRRQPDARKARNARRPRGTARFYSSSGVTHFEPGSVPSMTPNAQ